MVGRRLDNNFFKNKIKNLNVLFPMTLFLLFVIISSNNVIAFCAIGGSAYNILPEKVTPEHWPYGGEVAIVCGDYIQYTTLDNMGDFSASFGDELWDTCDICNGYVYVNVTNYDAGVYGEFETVPQQGTQLIYVPYIFLNKTLEPNAVIPFFAHEVPPNRIFLFNNSVFIKAGVVSEQPLSSCQLYWNDDIIDMPFEATPYGGYNCSINMTDLNQGRYTYRVKATNQENNQGFTEWRTLYILPQGLKKTRKCFLGG